MSVASLLDLLRWHPGTLRVQSLGDFVYFRIVYDYLSSEVQRFGLEMMGRLMGWAGSVALILMTLWLLLQGYRMATGSLREPMSAVVMNAARSVIILSTATSMAFMGTPLHEFLTRDMSRLIHYVVTGNDSDVTMSIDNALVQVQLVMSSIDAIGAVDGDPELSATKARAILLAGFGAAGPPITAGALLLTYQVALALFIGLGPLFIVALMFEQTRGMFQRWLFYGIGTLFSLAVLSFVISLTLKLLIAVSASFWAQKLLGGLTGLNLQEGISSQAAQQGGIGILLTLLILSTPPMVAAFFQGSLGHLMHYSAWAGNASIGNAGQPAGSYGVAAERLAGAAGGVVEGDRSAMASAPNPGSVAPPASASAMSTAPASASVPQLSDWPDGGFHLPRPTLASAGIPSTAASVEAAVDAGSTAAATPRREAGALGGPVPAQMPVSRATAAPSWGTA